MVKAVIFDLNGVFVKSPKLSDRFEEEFGIAPDQFLPALKEVLAKVRLPGAGDAYDYWIPYFKKWNVKLTRDAFYSFWFSPEQEIPEMISLAERLKHNGIKIFILSNNLKERTAYYHQRFLFLGEMDAVYYSWQTGFVKSDPRAYKTLLKEHKLKAADCLFFDDSSENIEAAAKLGIRSYLFENPAGVENILKKEGALK